MPTTWEEKLVACSRSVDDPAMIAVLVLRRSARR
jgi:hypothetical protein